MGGGDSARFTLDEIMRERTDFHYRNISEAGYGQIRPTGMIILGVIGTSHRAHTGTVAQVAARYCIGYSVTHRHLGLD